MHITDKPTWDEPIKVKKNKKAKKGKLVSFIDYRI